MDAIEPVLLVTVGRRPKVMPTSLRDDGTVIDVLRSALTRDLRGGMLCMPDLSCATITDIKVAGLAGPRSLDVSWSTYIILVLAGAFSLSIPVHLRLKTSPAQSRAPEDLANVLMETVKKNPGHYTRASASEIERRLKHAKTLAQMRRAFE